MQILIHLLKYSFVKVKKFWLKVFIDKTGSFVVLKDSRISREVKLKNNAKRDELLRIISSQQTNKYPDSFIVTEDITFKSPSQASSFCLGYNFNGLKDWKGECDGVVLKEVLISDEINAIQAQ